MDSPYCSYLSPGVFLDSLDRRVAKKTSRLYVRFVFLSLRRQWRLSVQPSHGTVVDAIDAAFKKVVGKNRGPGAKPAKQCRRKRTQGGKSTSVGRAKRNHGCYW
jgi:hypothetical protein